MGDGLVCVFKCRFHCYLRTAGPTDQEMIATEEIVCYAHRFQEREHAMMSHTGMHQGWSGDRGSEGKTGTRAFTGVLARRKGSDSVSRLRIG